jgi:hypothetical protein
MIDRDVLARYEYLDNVLKLCKNCDDDCTSDSSTSLIDGSVIFEITRDLYTSPESLFENPLLQISLHPRHMELYENLMPDYDGENIRAMQVCMDKLNENFESKYRFLEIGTGTGGAMRRVFPLIRHKLLAYTASDISVANTKGVDFPFDLVRWDINEKFPRRSAKFDVIFGSNSIHCKS